MNQILRFKNKITLLWKDSRIKIFAIYFLVILVFAIIYSFIPEDFYHSTIKYEDYFTEEVKAVESLIAKEIKENYKKDYGKIKFEDENYRYDASQIVVTELKSISKGINFTLLIPIFRNNPKVSSQIFTVKGTLSHSTRKIYDKSIIKSINIEPNNFHPLYQKFPIRSQGKYNTEMKFSNDIKNPFEVSEKLDDKLRNLYKTTKGFPSGINGAFFRMLYFSSTTMTGLGPGDILPLTNRARILVVIQSLLGLILIGIFLNEIAKIFNIKIPKEH